MTKRLHTTKEWEDALQIAAPGIEYTMMNLDHGKVITVIGTIKVGSKIRNAFWSSDGKCYVFGKRVKDYDITLQ